MPTNRRGVKHLGESPPCGAGGTWEQIVEHAGLTREDIAAAAQLYANAERVILCYGMGITQHGFGGDAVQMVLNLGLAKGYVGRVIASVNPLVPKPSTAYQWLPMEAPDVTDRKIKRLRSLMAGIDNVYFNIKSERHSYYQALLSLGDRRVADTIEAAARNRGQWRAAVAERPETGPLRPGFALRRGRKRQAPPQGRGAR